MKVLATAASVVLVASAAHAECVVVESEVRPSRKNALATVMMDGKAAKHLQLLVQIHLFPDGTESDLELTTNSRGNIDLKNLHVGRNCLTAYSATGETKWTGSICLDVTGTRDSRTTRFPLVLTALPVSRSMDEIMKEKEKLPIEMSVPAFAGTVTDLTGAMIPNAEISVYRRNAKKLDPVKVKTDDMGAFNIPLEPGTYTVVLMMSGFKTRFVALEIDKEAPKRSLSIDLQIGDSC